MEIDEKFHLIAELYLKYTSLSKKSDVDLNDLKSYITHAFENGLIREKELMIKELTIREYAYSDH